MILEGIVTTLSEEGTLNIAPMGSRIEPGWRALELRPYKTATTYRNLKARGEGVLHVTDDALLLARAAIGWPVEVASRPADVVRGRILSNACRYYEFRVTALEDQEDRTTISAEVVSEGRLRDFFGWNRAKHAVVEAAILATRVQILPIDEIMADLRRLGPLVSKTGGQEEREAFALLVEYVYTAAQLRGTTPEPLPDQ